MFDHIATFILRFRYPLLLLLLIATGLAAWEAHTIRFDFSPRSLFLTRDPQVQFLEKHREVFGDEDSFVIVMLEGDDIFTRPNLETLIELGERIEGIEHIDRVLSLGTLLEIGGTPGLIEVEPLLGDLPSSPEEMASLKRRTVQNRLYLHRFINPEGTATALLAKIDDGFIEELERRPVLAELERTVADVVQEGGPLTAYVLGLPIVNREYAVKLQQDMGRTMVASTLLVMLVLFLLFRNVYSVVLPGSAVGIAVIFTVAYMVATGDYFNIVNNIVPTLLLVIGIADAIHFMITYYQELGAGREQQEAVHRTVSRIGSACLATSVTAAVGFASLAVARIDIIKGMGKVAALGLMFSYVTVLIFVPTVLSIAKAPASTLSGDPRSGLQGRFLSWVAEICITRRKQVLLWTGIVSIVCIAGSLRVKSDNFLLEELWSTNPVSVAMHHFEDTLTGVMPIEIAIETENDGDIFHPYVLRGMEKLQQHLEADPLVGHSISVVDLVKELTRVMEGTRRIPESQRTAAQYVGFFEMGDDPAFLDSMVDVSRRKARISASVRDWGTKNFLAWYDGSGTCDPRALCGTPMLELIDQIFPPDGPVKVKATVTGGTLVAAKALSRLVEDMFASIITAFVVISILMMVMLRSVRVGLISMIPNVLPLLVTLGFMGWVGIPIRTSTALIFSISLGVAANDTIHFAARYREEVLASKDRIASIRRTMLSTGRAIIITSVLLVLGFGTMLTTRFVGIFQMGILGAVTLFAALLGVLLVLPVSLTYFRPWSRQVEGAEGGEIRGGSDTRS